MICTKFGRLITKCIFISLIPRIGYSTSLQRLTLCNGGSGYTLTIVNFLVDNNSELHVLVALVRLSEDQKCCEKRQNKRIMKKYEKKYIGRRTWKNSKPSGRGAGILRERVRGHNSWDGPQYRKERRVSRQNSG